MDAESAGLLTAVGEVEFDRVPLNPRFGERVGDGVGHAEAGARWIFA